MPTFFELIRNTLIVLVLMATASWLLSLVRVSLAVRHIPGKKEDIFDKLLVLLKKNKFSVKTIDATKGRIVTEGLVNIIDIVFYGLIGNRVVFQLTERMSREVQLRVYAYASFLSIRIHIRKSEQDKVIDELKINRVLDDLVAV